MSKIMKVVYKTEGTDSQWSSALGAYEDMVCFREESWRVGDNFNGEYIKGTITKIHWFDENKLMIDVEDRGALCIMNHDVCRLYYGE